MTPTKYAEWITQPCGCRWLLDIGTLLERDDSDCTTDHAPKKCLECGVMTEPDTISHGTFRPGSQPTTHSPRFGE